jgi:hypothetical protein
VTEQELARAIDKVGNAAAAVRKEGAQGACGGEVRVSTRVIGILRRALRRAVAAVPLCAYSQLKYSVKALFHLLPTL